MTPKYQYIKIHFKLTDAVIYEGYQEIDRGVVVQYRDMDGNTINFHEFTVCDSWVVDSNPVTPSWAELLPDVFIEEEEPV